MFLWEPWSAFKEAKLLKAMEQLAPGDVVVIKEQYSFPKQTGKFLFGPSPEELKEVIGIVESNVEDLDYKIESVSDDVSDVRQELEETILPIEQLQKDVAHLKNNTIPKQKGWPQVMDATMQELHREWLPLFGEKKNLQARLHETATAGLTDEKKRDEAGAMAAKILDLRDAIRKIYAKRDAYKATGKLPEEKKPFELEIPTDPNKWPITLANYQRYVRDYKAKLKKKPGNENFKKQLAKYEWGVAELKRLMNVV